MVLLIWFLSSNVVLALCFLMRYRAHEESTTPLVSDRHLASLTFLEWTRDREVFGTVLRCIESMDHSLRRQADVFLMESLLVQLISLQNMRGLTVDLPCGAIDPCLSSRSDGCIVFFSPAECRKRREIRVNKIAKPIQRERANKICPKSEWFGFAI